MSWLSKGLKKVGKGLKKLVTDPVGWSKNIAKQAKPIAGFIPGPLDDIALSVLSGGNMKDHLGAAAGGLVGPLGGALGKIGGFAGGQLSDLIPDGIGGAISGGLKKLGGMSAADLLAGVEGARGVYDMAQQYNQRNKALRSAEGAYNEKAGLRRLGVDGMMNQERPDLSSLYQDPGNVYNQPPASRGLRRIGGY